ncbi:hypothetical protein BDW02DRAFT_500077 [Decorospora gaudefroyi]|uniref:Ubiquitin carrier protein n=1 Tax=Decorospora gaudefroyi TaxID=184978 RepID=A0A6A5KD00_9PLEO|nr:hypothetical protein BDW02DRAFT_500077 [Decorospora gaudefroyi]
MTLLAELARRAISHPHTATFVKRAVAAENGDGERIQVPPWGIAVLFISMLLASVFVSLVSYTINDVVTALCMVESPIAAITVSPSTHEASDKQEEKETLLETGPTITLVNKKPITSSIRGTIRHLVANAGRFARFRGFKIYLLYSLLAGIVSTFFTGALPMFPGQSVIGAALTGAVLANIHAAWTHKVIGMPTDKTFRQHIPAWSQWKTLAGPSAIATIMPYISLYLTCGVAMLLRLHKVEQNPTTCWQWTSLVARCVAVLIFSVVCTLFLCIPAAVTLIRIEASMLPEDQDTIVPFDRTFGGKVVSKMMGGTGVVGFFDAWRSFNWEARRRLIKLFAKAFFIMTAIFVVVFHILLFEILAIMGPVVGKLLSQIQRDALAHSP